MILGTMILILFTISRTTRFHISMLYLFTGSKSPISTRVHCIGQTENLVANKFSLPLNFDTKSKNLLREYWHYSYYRQCLRQSGYDIHGGTIPKSNVVNTGSGFEYQNTEGLFKIINLDNVTIISDNVMDVDYDDRLLLSTLEINQKKVNLGVYIKHDKITDLSSAEDQFTNFPFTIGSIKSKEINTSRGSSFLYIEQTDGITGLVTILPNNKIILIYAPEISLEYLSALSQKIKEI